jgi:hypothetical protein
MARLPVSSSTDRSSGRVSRWSRRSSRSGSFVAPARGGSSAGRCGSSPPAPPRPRRRSTAARPPGHRDAALPLVAIGHAALWSAGAAALWWARTTDPAGQAIVERHRQAFSSYTALTALMVRELLRAADRDAQ